MVFLTSYIIYKGIKLIFCKCGFFTTKENPTFGGGVSYKLGNVTNLTYGTINVGGGQLLFVVKSFVIIKSPTPTTVKTA